MSVIRSAGPPEGSHGPRYEPGSLRDLAADLQLSASDFYGLAEVVGVRREDVARPLDRLGTLRARREIESIQTTRIERRQAWNAGGIEPSEQGWWQAVGIDDASAAIAWRSAGFDPRESSSWRRRGVTAPTVAAQLRDSGVEPVGLFRFTKAGVSVSVATEWLLGGLADHDVWSGRIEWSRAEFMPADAVRWFELGATAQQASILQQHFSPEEARVLLSGSGSTGRLIDLIRRGTAREHLDGWMRSELSDEQVARWDRAGFGPVAASAWIRAGIASPETAAKWINVSGDPVGIRDWLEAGVKFPTTASRWIAEGFTADQAGSWLACGIDNPVNARMIEQRLPMELAADLTSVGFSSVEIAQWSKDRVALGQLRSMLEQLIGNRAMFQRWHYFEIPIVEWPRWMEHLFDDPERAAAWRTAGLHPSDLWRQAAQDRRRFLQLGDRQWSSQTGEANVHAQQQPGLPSVKNSDDYESWRADGDYWVRAANLRGRGGPFLRDLFDRGRRWASLDSTLSVGWPAVSSDWLDDAAAHAYAVRDHLRVAPIWPIVYDSDDLTIELAVVDSRAIAWVERGDRGLIVSFDTVTFETWLPEHSQAACFAAGVAIHWFVDCCISLRPGRSHPHLQIAGLPQPISGNHMVNEVVRYVPTQDFHEHVRAVRTGILAPPRAHHVAGFVRRLPDGWQPTTESLANAPAHVRRAMKDNETFVRDHTRGNDEAAVRVVRRLGAHSSLADALGQIDTR